MLQQMLYVASMFVNVSFVSDVCCSKCFMLQVGQYWLASINSGVPLGLLGGPPLLIDL
jgi:hypothetical protein